MDRIKAAEILTAHRKYYIAESHLNNAQLCAALKLGIEALEEIESYRTERAEQEQKAESALILLAESIIDNMPMLIDKACEMLPQVLEKKITEKVREVEEKYGRKTDEQDFELWDGSGD